MTDTDRGSTRSLDSYFEIKTAMVVLLSGWFPLNHNMLPHTLEFLISHVPQPCGQRGAGAEKPHGRGRAPAGGTTGVRAQAGRTAQQTHSRVCGDKGGPGDTWLCVCTYTCVYADRHINVWWAWLCAYI